MSLFIQYKKLFSLIFSIFLIILLTQCGGAGGGTGAEDSGDDSGTGGTSLSNIATSFTNDATYGALMVGDDGEALAVIGAVNLSNITGAVWRNTNGVEVTVFVDENGYPTQAVVGQYILLYENYTSTTVDVALIYTPTGYIEVFKNVSVDSSIISQNSSALQANMQLTCFPACETDEKNLAEGLKVGGLALTVGLCAVGTAISFGAAIVPCAGLLISTAAFATGDEDYGLISDVLAVAGCATGSCTDLVISGLSKIAEGAGEINNDNDVLVSTAFFPLREESNPGGVIQEGGGLPNCPGTYSCTPDTYTYMPCLAGGTKQCGSDCTWGSCGTDSSGGTDSPGVTDSPGAQCAADRCEGTDGLCYVCNESDDFCALLVSLPSNATCDVDNSVAGVTCCTDNCGDGTCDAAGGETEANCPNDCSALIGTWAGTYNATTLSGGGGCTYDSGGSLSMTLSVDGSSFSGSSSTAGLELKSYPPCEHHSYVSSNSGTVSGSFTGSSLTGSGSYPFSGAISGTYSFSWTATISGNTISGNYTGGKTGSFTLTRQ